MKMKYLSCGLKSKQKLESSLEAIHGLTLLTDPELIPVLSAPVSGEIYGMCNGQLAFYFCLFVVDDVQPDVMFFPAEQFYFIPVSLIFPWEIKRSTWQIGQLCIKCT